MKCAWETVMMMMMVVDVESLLVPNNYNWKDGVMNLKIHFKYEGMQSN